MIFTLTPVLILATLSTCSTEAVLTTDKIDLQKSNLTLIPHIPINSFAGSHITRVIFSHNNIETLTERDFDTLSQFPNTRYMFFDNNRISQVGRNTFSRLVKLKHLDLSKNALGEVSSDFYDELMKLDEIKYVNLKRNPLRDFDNVYRLINRGIDVDFDGMNDKNRKRRLVNELLNDSDSSKVRNTLEDGHLSGFHELLEEGHEERNITDKPRKAMVVDTKRNQNTLQNQDDKSSRTMESIIFNLFTAGLILVALPVGMVIYYLLSRRREYS